MGTAGAIAKFGPRMYEVVEIARAGSGVASSGSMAYKVVV